MKISEQFKFKKAYNQKIYEAKEINPGKGAYEVKSLLYPIDHFICFDRDIEEQVKNGSWIIIEETIKPINHTFADEINHPSHYTSGKIETIDYIVDKLNKEQFEGYVIGNVIKYVSRYKLKGGYKDIRKAKWYIDKLLELEDHNG